MPSWMWTAPALVLLAGTRIRRVFFRSRPSSGERNALEDPYAPPSPHASSSSVAGTHAKGDVYVERLRPEYSNAAAELLVKAFREHPCSLENALGKRGDPGFGNWLRDFHVKEASLRGDPPSFVALIQGDAHDDTTVGGVLTLMNFEEDSHPGDDPISRLLNAAHNLFDAEYKKRAPNATASSCSQVLYFAFIGVDPEAQRGGFAKLLLTTALANPEVKKHYDVYVAFCTHRGSQRAFERVGFQTWGSIPYATFDAPATPFKSLPDALFVMVKVNI